MDTIDEDENKKTLSNRHPEANTALFLGICSILLSLGPLGLAAALFAIVAGTRTIKAYNANPENYSNNSHSRGLAGIVCGIVTILIFLLTSLFYVLIS